MKIAFFEIEGWEERFISWAFQFDVHIGKDKIGPLCMPEHADFEVISTFVDSRIDAAVLDCFPKLKMIAARSTGYDHIDIAECKKRGIMVSNVPAYGENTVAEFTFGLILALTRKIYASIDQVKETGSFVLTGLRGTDLKGKTIGIVGTGRIGKEVARIAKGFEMNVMGFDPYPDEAFALGTGMTYAALDDLLASSDIITLHCPYSKKTHHLLNATNIPKIKRGAYLINTARGAVMETDALIAALQDGIVAGAGLDVLEEEGETKDEVTLLRRGRPREDELKTMLQNHMLMKMPNVLVTPHNAFNSNEALERILSTTLENIKGFMDGKPVNVVNP